MKKLLKWFLAFLGIVACFYLFAFVFGVWGSYEMKKRFDIGYGASTSPRLVRLEIGDKVFAIPQNHIWSRDRWQDGKVTGVNLQALLPNFEPYTETNKQEFEKPGWNREISFLLSEHNIANSPTGKTSMTRKDVYERIIRSVSQQLKPTKDFPGPFGLTLKKWIKPSPGDKELYVGHKKNGDFYWIKCDPDNPKEFPSCSTYIEYSKQVTIHYTFSKQYLSDWKTIDQGVLNLIHQFEINAKQGK